MSVVLWLLLLITLSVSTFGLWTCCLFLVSALFTLIGCGVMLYSGQELRLRINFKPTQSYGRCSTPFPGIPKVVEKIINMPASPKADERLTGSKAIDEPLREIIMFIMRDFIHSWYQEVSSNEEFVFSVNEMIKNLINNFSKNSKEVDWVSFFTKQIVEDFTSHLRLYRHAEMVYKRTQKEKLDLYTSIESAFFELEANMELNLHRENASTSEEYEKEYLQTISDVILYLLLPPEDFNCRCLKQFLREVLVCGILQPMVSQFSDSDYINQQLVWLCKDHMITSKSLLSVLRRSDSNDELLAFIQIAKHELKVQKSKDTGDKDEMKRYIKSINFIQEFANQRHQRLLGQCKQVETDSAEFYLGYDMLDYMDSASEKKIVSLPFDVILNNNIALHYFSEYLSNMGAEGYVFFYHNVEGFRTTAKMILKEKASVNEGGDAELEKLRGFAMQIFEAYLGENAAARVNLDENILKKLISRIKTENITDKCFDEVQEKVHEILENEFYLTGFKNSRQYIKLLAELDLLQDLSNTDSDSLSSLKSEEDEYFNCDTVVPTDEKMLTEFLDAEITSSDLNFPAISSGIDLKAVKEIGSLTAEVHSTGITHHAGKTFAVYAISISHQRIEGPEEKWFVVRRYSEFYDFHEMLIKKYPQLSDFSFPSKKPFNNLSRQLMEKRRHMLNEFVQFLLEPENLETCEELKVMLYNFLQPNVCEKGKKSFIRTVGSFVNPIKTSVKTVGEIVKLVPDTFLGLKDGLVKAFGKSSRADSLYSVRAARVIPGKDVAADDIPFRIILLLMDEVFNLRNKDLWFRRRIMALLRQIIKTMQGGAINKKIKDYVQGMTSASQVAEWLKLLSKAFWPNGVFAESAQERDYNTKMRTRIVAKILLLCAIPDELKHIIGYETSYKGAMLIINMFQHSSLNRRLLFVFFESFLNTLFPNNKFPELFQKIHSHHTSRRNSGQSATSEQVIKDQQTPKEKRKSDKSNMSKPSAKFYIDDNTKLNLQCLSVPSAESSPISGHSKKTEKSLEGSVFYADSSFTDSYEDIVVLPLGR